MTQCCWSCTDMHVNQPEDVAKPSSHFTAGDNLLLLLHPCLLLLCSSVELLELE